MLWRKNYSSFWLFYCSLLWFGMTRDNEVFVAVYVFQTWTYSFSWPLRILWRWSSSTALNVDAVSGSFGPLWYCDKFARASASGKFHYFIWKCGIHTYHSRHYLTRPALVAPQNSPWKFLLVNGDDLSFVNAVALTRVWPDYMSSTLICFPRFLGTIWQRTAIVWRYLSGCFWDIFQHSCRWKTAKYVP